MRQIRYRNPPKLSDCPVLRRKHWTEEDALVAMDWALERGLIDDAWIDDNGHLEYLPQHIRAALARGFRPQDFGVRVVWEEDEDADWSWLEQSEFADEDRAQHIALWARVQSQATQETVWHDEPVSLSGIDFLRSGLARQGLVYADEVAHVAEGGRPFVHNAARPGRGDPYQLEVSRELIDEFGALDPESRAEEPDWSVFNLDYRRGYQQAGIDETQSPRGLAEVRVTLADLYRTHADPAFISGYERWLCEREEEVR